MKKIIRMTEADLTRLVKRVIQEQSATGSPDLATPDEIKKMADEIKRGVGTFGNTNVRTLENGINFLRLKSPETIRKVYKELGIQSLEEYVDDEFMAYQITKGQKNDPLGKKIHQSLGGEQAERILTTAKKIDAFIRAYK